MANLSQLSTEELQAELERRASEEVVDVPDRLSEIVDFLWEGGYEARHQFVYDVHAVLAWYLDRHQEDFVERFYMQPLAEHKESIYWLLDLEEEDEDG